MTADWVQCGRLRRCTWNSASRSKKKGIIKLRIYFLLFFNSKLSELFGRDGRAQAGRLCYFSLGFRHTGGAARSRAHCIIGVPPVFPICAKGNNQKPESQTWAPEPFEDTEPSFHKHSYRLAPIEYTSIRISVIRLLISVSFAVTESQCTEDEHDDEDEDDSKFRNSGLTLVKLRKDGPGTIFDANVVPGHRVDLVPRPGHPRQPMASFCQRKWGSSARGGIKNFHVRNSSPR